MSSENNRQDIVLIVDANSNNLRMLADFLDNAGFEVMLAKSGKVALERVKSTLPDLILLDVMMPDMDGFETCRQLKENLATHEIPIVFMTANSDIMHKIEGLDLGAVDYITKPFHPQEVLDRVNLHLKLHSLTKQMVEQNLILEQRVAERTAELNQALHELQTAQIQLIQNEKLSSLGQLVAGVAHEINNPVNFIYVNLIHASEYIHKILEVVQLYQKYCPDPDREITDKINACDLNFLIEDLPKLINSMKVGSERIQEIVSSLRNFCRTNEVETAKVDIHVGIDSTLMILRNRLNAIPNSSGIEVIRDYGTLPMVECYPGQLNQVFMNLLCNAIDAIEEHNCQRTVEEIRANPSKIRIQTEMLDSDWIRIKIIDNGLGMNEEVLAQMFNPFFTTKPIGKGTGMGLAISHAIVVEKHGGQLSCLSEPGQGTEFIIQIPVQQTIRSTSSSPGKSGDVAM
jgi:two-component system, NtrC family, sensor kinase